MKRIVITGALGHIGSAFIRALSPGRFEDVLLVDNLATQRYCSLFDLPADIPFRFLELDICEGDLDALVDGADLVIHLAAVTNAAASFGDETHVERVNFAATERLVRACVKSGARLLFASTTSV